jgi:hypothetical protein
MNPFTLLATLSLLGAAGLFVALILFLRAINFELEAIGGPATRFHEPMNYLAKIRLGLRAIEVETGGLAPEVTRLNAGLGSVAEGLESIDANLGGLIEAVSKQEAR